MLISLLNYVQGIKHTVKKSDVLSSAENIFNNIENDVIPTLASILDSDSIKCIDNNRDLKIISNNGVLKAKDNKDLLGKIKKVFENILKEHKTLIKVINKELPDIITNKTITAKDAAILRVINDIGGMSLYCIDLCYYILIIDGKTDYPKIKLNQIKEGLPTFNNMLKVYSKNFNKLVSELPKVANQNIDLDEGSESMLETLLAKKGKIINLPVAHGFVNNPFYHIRMWMLDKEIEKYESLKDKKRLVELRLMELKLNERNESDPKLRGQIEYYENKLTRIEYNIKEIEED